MTCSKEKDARVPWKYVVEEPDTFVDAKYLPDGVKLKDTEKLVAVEVDALLNHWRRRQQRPSEGPVFLFRRYRMKDGTLGVPDSSYIKMKGAKGKGKEANSQSQEDVDEFLKPSVERAAANRPRLDVSIAQRWPDPNEVRQAGALPPDGSQNVNGWRKRRRRAYMGEYL